MGLVSESCKEQIRARVPLEELLREYNVALTPVGKRLRALCPFHAEKTASFYVDVERQTYHCFGCQEHGDVFKFLQKTHQVDFPQSLELLARRAGVTLDNEPSGSRRDSRQSLLRFYDALDLAREFYQDFLREDPAARPAREYLLRRGIERASWDRFHLGYSPPEWDALCAAAARRGVAAEVLEAAGLARRREHSPGHYDYFRGRVMFPVEDPQGRTIGFGARTLGDDVPKYLNSPKTPVFDKSQVLYSLPQARTGIQKAGMIAIVEGYTDAIVAHQAGLDFFVASLGTAFTRENARRLGRLAPRVLLIFDGDAAGQKATERSLDLLVAESVDVRIYTVTDGKDPCDAILALGPEEFRRRIQAEAVGIFEFKWRRTVEAPETKGAGAAIRARALDEFLDLLAKVPNVVARKLIVREFSERIGVPEEDIATRMRELSRRSQRSFGRSTGGPEGVAGGSRRVDSPARAGSTPPIGSRASTSGGPTSRGLAAGNDEWRNASADSMKAHREVEDLAPAGFGREAGSARTEEVRDQTVRPIGARENGALERGGAGDTRDATARDFQTYGAVTPRPQAESRPGALEEHGEEKANSRKPLEPRTNEPQANEPRILEPRTLERQGKLEELILECCLAQPEHAESLLGDFPGGCSRIRSWRALST